MVMQIGIPQLLVIVLGALGIAVNVYCHGKRATINCGPYIGRAAVFLALLLWGGFFTDG